jgi:hypothetical protein
MRPHALSAALFVASMGLPLAVGCTKEKAPVEKLADQIAASNSAKAAAESASVNVVDPKEQKYATLLKAMRDRNVAFMTSLQKLYAPEGKDEVANFKTFFPKDAKGQKEADDLSKEAVFTGKEGMAITNFDVNDITLDDKLSHSTAYIFEKQMQRGKPRCITYKLQWDDQGGSAFVRTAKTDLLVVPCDQAK